MAAVCFYRSTSFMMLRKFISTAIVLLPLWTLAQYSISGTISSKENKQTLTGATVILKNTYHATQTNIKGQFSFEKLSAEKYIVQISLVGYKTNVDTFALTGNKIIEIQLEESPVLMEEVQVAATRVDEKSAMAFTNISKEELGTKNLGQDLPYLLNQTPSVVVTSDAGAGVGYTAIRIRGTDATGINTTINGVPINDAEESQTFWVDLPDIASSVDNIQVQRGAGTSTNGAGAFGGSLNIQTTKLNSKAYAELSNSAGSFNTLKNTVSFGTGLIDEHWSVDGRLSKIASDGYIQRASSNLKSFYLSGGYYGKSTIVKAIIFSGVEKTGQAWNGVPEDSLKTNRTFNGLGMYTDLNGNTKYYDNQTDNYQQDYYQLHLSHEFSKSWNLNAALHYTKGRGYYEEYRQNDNLNSYGLQNVISGTDTITTTDLIRRKWLDNDFYGTTYSLNYLSNKKLNATVGGAWNQYHGGHFGEVIWARYASNGSIRERYYDNSSLKTDFTVFAKVNYQVFEKLNVFGDLQYRTVDYSFLGYNASLENVKQTATLAFINPKAGLTYHLNTNTLAYASYSVANKEPNRADYTQSSPGTRPKPETLNDYELGVKQNYKKISWGLNYYYMDYKNQLVLNGQINDVGAYNRTNIEQSYRTGLEAELSVRPIKRLQWMANITISSNKVKNYTEYLDDYDTGNQKTVLHSTADIAYSPSLIASSTIAIEVINNFTVNFISKYVGKQYLDNTSTDNRKLPAYFVNDIRLNYSIQTRFIKNISLMLMINNILNEKYSSNGYTYAFYEKTELTTQNVYYPQAGTNYLIGLSLKF